jgi:trans-aconitate 2-methyltransferase
MTQTWNAPNYDADHAYVWTLAAGLVDLLDPKPGKTIVDLGCGTGHLTAQIAQRGATMIGLDASPEMIRQAKQNYPALDFRVADATAFALDQSVDAVFSNATLHWITRTPAAAAVARIHNALRPGGRFVAEFGGHGNVRQICRAIDAGLDAVDGPKFDDITPWYYPSIAAYATLLDSAGFDVRFATLSDRPTPLPAGLRNWLEMYGQPFLAALPSDRHDPFLSAAEAAAKPTLFKDGQWTADYRRLRIFATPL